jgi:Protein of unknown function (DUF3050)
MNTTQLNNLQNEIEGTRQLLVQHPLYKSIRTPAHVIQFMEHHVFAVWDFMSLVKSLQHELTVTQWPWFTRTTPELRRLINEIVLGEESDIHPAGGFCSHFELYLEAMNQCGARTNSILAFCKNYETSNNLTLAFNRAPVLPACQNFVAFTMGILQMQKPHCTAAVFTFGREDLIPDMFIKLLHHFDLQDQKRFSTFNYYLKRHIEIDGEQHGKMALSLVSHLCGTDPLKWQEATSYAIKALDARRTLWDAVLTTLQKS